MKRVWKRWGALLLAVVMTLSLLPTAALAATDADGNIAYGKTIHAYNASGGSEDAIEDGNGVANMVDGNSTSRWAAKQDMKGTGAAENPAKTVILDLGEGKYATGVTKIVISWYMKVWAKNYTISTAATEDATEWTTVYTAPGRADGSAADGVEDTITSLETDTLQRFVKFVFADINGSAGGSGISIREIEVYGTLEDVPVEPEQATVTQYIRHTGAIEEGTYIIYDGDGEQKRNLHNGGTTTNQCGTPAPVGDKIGVGDGNHLWRIAGNSTDGYTIQGDKEGSQNYLTATVSGTQLTLSANKDDAVKLTFTPSGNGYHISKVSDENSYFCLRDAGNGWNFNSTARVVQLFKETVIPVTIASADDNSRDVGVTDGTYHNSDPKVIHAWASSQHASGTDGPATWATDNDTSSIWHTRYDDDANPADAENTEPDTTSKAGWKQNNIAASVENRWIELDIVAGAQWLSGLRYKGRSNSNGGTVTSCEIRVWVGDDDTGSWATVTSDTVWTMEGANHGEWKYKEFDYPVLTSKVRLYGVTTDCANNQYMVASDIRLVKALTEAAPATQTATVTVTGLDGNAIAGATVTGGGAAATTNENGVATLDLVDGKTHTITVTKEGYVTRKITVSVDGAAVEANVTLRTPLTATDATRDYPLTDSMVSAVSEKSPTQDNDGYAWWAIDYDDSHWWHQVYGTAQDVWFTFALPAEVAIAGIRYQQRNNGEGAFGDYEIQTSADGTTWTTLAGETGTWSDHNVHVHTLTEPQTAKYFRVHRTGGNASNRTAKLFQLVLDESACTTVTGTVTKGGQAMSGVTVQVYHDTTATYKKATTDSSGNYSIVLPRNDGQTWKLAVDAAGCKHAEKTATTSGATDTQNFELETRELHLTGTAPAGTTVQLMQGAGRLPVADVAAQTGTSFNFDVSNLAAGTYYLRAWKDGCVPAWKEVTWTAATENLDAVTVAESDLAAVPAGNITVDVTGFKVLNEENATAPAVTTADGALQIAFTDSTRQTMWHNAVGHPDYQLKNGTIEFDITPTTGSNNAYKRLGLALRQDANNYLYVGHGDGAGAYFAQNSTRATSNDVSGQYHEENGSVQLVKDLKRHVKVTLNEGTVTMWVDGIQVLNWTNAYNQGIGLVAFTSEANHTVKIENLNITRSDTAGTVTWTTQTGETLNAVITTPYNQTGVALQSGGTAYAGDTIKITGSKDGAVLNAVTVNGSADGVTKTAAEGGGYTYTFAMPAENAAVVGTFVPLIPAFTVSGADASGNISAGTIGESGFTGNTLAIQGELASDTNATFKWYKKTGDGAWTQITGAAGSSYTLKQSDYNSSTTTKLKVEVIGSGDHHAGSRESGEFTVTAPVYAVTGVTLHRSSLTMWTNYTPTGSEEFPAEVGGTATLTATVAPDEVTGATVTWTSDNAAVTVTKSTTNDYEATVTAVSKGTANITVSVTAGGATKTATCAVTVMTRVAAITVKNGETEIAENGVVKVYLNDGDTEAPRTVTLVGTVAPTDANDKGLTWTRTSGATGKINIQPVGGSDQDPDSAASSGSGVTISAVGNNSTNVGEVTVKVAAHDGKGAEKTFKVQVWRKLAHDITIGGTLKYGEELEVNTDSLDMTAAGKAALTYAWSRTDKDGTVTTFKTGTGDAGKKYTLTEADVGCTITVTVTADGATFYEGSKTATTGKVALADGPAKPTLSATDVNGDTKGSITITTVAGAEYEYRMQDADTQDWGEWTTDNLEDGVISNLEAGNYQVRVQETTTHAAGAAETVTVRDVTVTYYDVTVTTDPTTGAGTAERSAASVEANGSVTLTVTPADGYDIKSVTVGGEALEGVATGTGRAMKYTVSNVQADVEFAVEFGKKTVTVTFALTHVTATCDAHGTHTNNDTHEVEYGEVHVITLEADAGWKLPERITVTYTDPDVTDPSARWSYNQENGTITFTYGTQKDITITVEADELAYSVEMATTGGHIDLEGDENTVKHGATFNGTLTVTDTATYELPDSLDSVTMGGEELASTAYTYTSSTGAISIPNVTGDVVITATAKAKKTQLTGVTISILHNDGTGMGSGNENVPHVGDTLTATAAPTGATVTYQWFVGESTTAAGTSQTYTVKDTDLGKTIKVVVTGTGTFEGTEEATTAAVGAKTWRVSGVSLNKETTSLVFGEEETLTATITPSTATNKKVTWSSDNENAATVDANGKITAVGVGTATITVTTEDGGQTATCAVTVTAKALPALQITTPKEGETVRVTFAGGVSTNVANYEWYTGESNDAENGTWYRVDGVSGASWQVTGVPAGRYIKVIAYAKSGENYTGHSTVVSAAILSAGTLVETFDITTTKEGNGTVTVKVNDATTDRATEGDAVTIEVTGVATGATVEVATTTEGVTLTKGAGNTWTFTMPAKAVEITVTITGGTAAEKHAITISDSENGTVTASVDGNDVAEASEGETVTLTVTPDTGYTLESLTVTKDGGAVTVTTTVTDDGTTTYTFTMPGEAVTVTATFEEDETPLDTSELAKAITDAQKLHDSVVVADSGEEVPNNKKFVTDEAVKTALQDAIDAAQEVLNDESATQAEVNAAVDALNAAVETFNAACQPGEKKTSNPAVIVLPSEEPKVTEDEDGNKITTETKPDGTTVVTTEKPDGTVEVVETKKDGTVTETVTEPDGTVNEVVTEPNGTVTETTTQPDGAKVEKVTDPEEGVTITATDAEGETVAEVAIPAAMPELTTRFEDVPVGHWADKAIHQLAAIEIVEGVGDNKYDMVSSMSRGALATVLHRLSSKPAGSEVTFEDVLDGKYYTEGVAWAAKVGVVKGFNAEEFRPDEAITREQLALMLVRYAKLLGMDTSADALELAKFTDGTTTHAWALDGVAWCVKAGILQGKDGNVLDPTADVKRAEVAVMIDRFLGLL